MVRSHPPAFAFIDDDLARTFYIEIDIASIGKNDPQAKAFHADLFDRFALHRFEVQYSFRLRPYHDSERITDSMALHECISPASDEAAILLRRASMQNN